MSEVELDESQRAAIEIEAAVRQLVIAGPGSGKTEVLSRLVEHLVSSEGVDEVDGILVISFSNAAVFAADARLGEIGANPVTVQTMDSLAGQVIRDLGDDDVASLNFDQRIQRATALLSEEGWDRLDLIEHLVVDEVQDVVGVRADFLLTLIRSLAPGAGFSLLGDPAQGIYDWQLRAEHRPPSLTTSLALLAATQRLNGVEAKELTGQYRARSRDAKRVVALRDSALRTDGHPEIEEFLADLPAGMPIEEAAAAASKWGGTTAFLTANNGQALITADAIAAAGVPVELRRSAHQRVLASWIAVLLADSPTAGLTREEIDQLVQERLANSDPAEVWRALRSVTGGRGREVNVANLTRGLLRPSPLLPHLIEPIHSKLVVSTVHRAKGLEFDNVVYTDFSEKPWLGNSDPNLDDGEPARRLFVALSRSRDLLIRADGPDDRWLRSIPPRAGRARRWYIGGFRDWMTLGFELRVDDLDRAAPPGRDPEATQSHIASKVKPGDSLRIAVNLDKSTLHLPAWDLLHQGHVVGTTSAIFGEAIVQRIKPIEKRKRGWPGLSGARVESVATIASPPQQGATGRFGLWLAPACVGMLRIDWNGDSDA